MGLGRKVCMIMHRSIWSWTAFHFPLLKKEEMLSKPVFEFTPIRAPHEAVVNIAWVKLHRMFAPLPFFT